MIQEYQEEQQAPLIVDGEARKYMKSDYAPSFPVSFENLRTTDKIDEMIKEYRQGRTDISNEILNVDEDIKDTNNYILALKKEIDETGRGSTVQYRKEIENLKRLNKERKNLEKEIEKYNYYLKNLENREGILKDNTLINKTNREEVIKYEQ